MALTILKTEQLLNKKCKEIFLLIIFILIFENSFELIMEYNITQIK